MTPEQARFREILAQEYQRLDRPEYAEWVLAPGELDVCDQAALAAMQRAARMGEVPEGWQALPTELTLEMLGALLDTDLTKEGSDWRHLTAKWKSRYAAMLAASPQHCKEG